MGNFYMEATQINYRRDDKPKTVDQKLQEVTTEISSLKSGLTNYQTQNDINLEVPDRINLFDKDNIDSINKYYDGDNWINQGSGGWKTVFVPVVAGRTYTSSGFPNHAGTASVFVKSDKNTVLLAFASSNNNSTFVVPDMAEYVGFAIWTPDEDYTSTQLELGSTATAYAPYIPSVESRIEAVESGLTNLLTPVIGTVTYGSKTESSQTDVTRLVKSGKVVQLWLNAVSKDNMTAYENIAVRLPEGFRPGVLIYSQCFIESNISILRIDTNGDVLVTENITAGKHITALFSFIAS